MVYEFEIKGEASIGRPKTGFTKCVEDVLHERGLDIQAARKCVNSRNKWHNIRY